MCSRESVSLDDISCRLSSMNRDLLHKVSLKLYEGDFLVILGSNGSGKSSLLKCMNGELAITKGQLYLSGSDFTNQGTQRVASKVATLGQSIDFSTYGSLTVAENCKVVCKCLNDEVLQVLHQCHPDLPHRLNTLASSLSGGQRQCLALALCLLRDPEVLLLDEHTSALDPRIAKEVMNTTHKVSVIKKSMTVVMTTHSLHDALNYGNKLLVMQRGCCVFEASGDEKHGLSKEDLLKFYN